MRLFEIHVRGLLRSLSKPTQLCHLRILGSVVFHGPGLETCLKRKTEAAMKPPPLYIKLEIES
jgi:hypothetical protein